MKNLNSDKSNDIVVEPPLRVRVYLSRFVQSIRPLKQLYLKLLMSQRFYGNCRVQWVADKSGAVPGADRAWRVGDRYMMLHPDRDVVVFTSAAGGMNQETADFFNEGFRWKAPSG